MHLSRVSEHRRNKENSRAAKPSMYVRVQTAGPLMGFYSWGKGGGISEPWRGLDIKSEPPKKSWGGGRCGGGGGVVQTHCRDQP